MTQKELKELKDFLADVYQYIVSFPSMSKEEKRLSDKADKLSRMVGKELNYLSPCDNTSCPDFEPTDIKQVKMRKEFEGGWFNWCFKCRKRDKDMISEIKYE